MTKSLLLIEFQQEWLNPKGKLYPRVDSPARLKASIEQAKKALSHARKNGWLIAHSGLTFKLGYPELGKANLGLRSHIPHRQTFLAGNEGTKFHSDFESKEGELLVEGRLGTSAFSGSNLNCKLHNHQVTELFIMGYALHVCVESTLRAAHDLGYETRVITDASAAFTEKQEDYFKQHVASHFGQAISTEEFISASNCCF